MVKGSQLTEEHKRKISESHKGSKNPNYGKKPTEETRRKLSLSTKGTKRKPLSLEHRIKISISNGGDGDVGNKTREMYPLDFTIELKNQIKDNYNGYCQLCFNKKRLGIHHIDYDKKNTNDNNLIPLCRPCHALTNFNREGWRTFFNRLKQRPTPHLHIHLP